MVRYGDWSLESRVWSLESLLRDSDFRLWAPLEKHRLAIRPVHRFQNVANLVESAIGPGAVQHRRDDVLIGGRGGSQRLEFLIDRVGVPSCPEFRHPFPLRPLGLLANLENLR